MGFEQIAILVAGALAGGIVNGLTGFGTAITALGIWVYAIAPTTAASLAIVCSVVSQLQTLHLIWRTINWPRVLVFVIPGVAGVPSMRNPSSFTVIHSRRYDRYRGEPVELAISP